MKRFFGFTLAETLVTLGIIGVVASLTMPTLVVNHQKKVVVTQLEQTVSLLQQGFIRMINDNNAVGLNETPFCLNMKGEYFVPYRDRESAEILKKYFKGLQLSETSAQVRALEAKWPKNSSGGNSWLTTSYNVGFLPNGAAVNFHITKRASETPQDCDTIKAKGAAYCKFMSSGWSNFPIDVNGLKGPNMVGRDIFYFVLTDTGVMFPAFDKNWSLFNTGEPATAWYIYDNPTKRCPMNASQVGRTPVRDNYSSCAARIVMDGWKINYYWNGTTKY